jgi:hypothetical protein
MEIHRFLTLSVQRGKHIHANHPMPPNRVTQALANEFGLQDTSKGKRNMALVKRTNLARTSSGHDDDAAISPHRRLGPVAPRETANGHAANGHDDSGIASVAANSALAEAQKRKARTFARQQKAAERIAAATSQLASGITEASAAAIEMGKAADQIASGAEEAAGASQQSLKAVNHAAALILKAKDNADASVAKPTHCSR